MSEDRLLSVKEVVQITSMSKSSIYARIREGTFPARIQLGHRTSRWKASEIQNWLNQLTQ
jgi:prophage regulatory protein